ncbi:MAG: response regulator [Nitrospirota bacterium]
MNKSEFKILIADDDAIVRDVIVKFLTDEGYPVIAANDGIAAMKSLRLEDVKLVLTDLRMPGADGMEVLRAAIQTDPRTPVVLLTAYGTLDTALEAMKEGAYDYIVKPFVMQQLLLVVRNAYRMASLIEENEKLSGHLKEIYRQLDAVKNPDRNKGLAGASTDGITAAGNPAARDMDDDRFSWRAADTGSESDILRRYSSLVKDLKER